MEACVPVSSTWDGYEKIYISFQHKGKNDNLYHNLGSDNLYHYLFRFVCLIIQFATEICKNFNRNLAVTEASNFLTCDFLFGKILSDVSKDVGT